MKRRDNKGQILRNGETQEKSVRYVYTYYESGEQRKLYSWRLEPTDPLPYGKRECVSLRKQSEKIERLRYLGIMPDSMTVLELVELYTETRNNVRQSTLAGYPKFKTLITK